MVKSLVAVVMAVVALHAGAQQHVAELQFDEDARPNAAQVLALLNSKDPRVIAWGATYALNVNDERVTEKIEALIEDGPPGASSNADGADAAGRNVMLALLDAAIQRQLRLSVASIAELDNAYTVQAVVLASRLPLSSSTPLLMDWWEDGMRGDAPTLKARVAGMLLSKEPPPGFVAGTVRSAQERLVVDVNAAGSPMTGSDTRGGPICSDTVGEKPVRGWPQLYTYYTGGYGRDVMLVAQLGRRRVSYVREPVTEAHGNCAPPETANSFRFFVLSALLGLRTRDGSSQYWQAERHTSLIMQNDADFTQQLQQKVSQAEQGLSAGVQALHDLHLLNDDEAAAVRPRLLVVARDERGADAPTLPDVSFADGRTTFAVEQGVAAQ